VTTNSKCAKCATELSLTGEGTPLCCNDCGSPAGKRRGKSVTHILREYPATTFLLSINIALFFGMTLTSGSIINFGATLLVRWGGDFGPATIAGDYWRLITASFIHAGFFHIGINMWCLYALGPICERVFGKLQTIAIYLLCGTSGLLLSLAHDPHTLAVGASAAIFGIAGSIVAGAKFSELTLRSAQKKTLIFIVVIFLVSSFAGGGSSSGVDNFAHIGGFISGLVIGFPLGGFAHKRKIYQAGIFAVTSLLILVAGHRVVHSYRAEGLLYRASTATALKNYGEAIHYLENYRSIHPDDLQTLVWLGDLYSTTNQRDKATGAYQHALRIYPDSEEAQEGLDKLRETALTTNK
jgi:membrane associated rhomboid family serine protease